MPTHSRLKRIIHIAGAFALVTNLLTTATLGPAAFSSPLGGANDTTLAREPQLTPAGIGDGSIDGLQFADPTEGLALVQPPGASNDGGAHLSYPLLIPKGRGIAPDLSLEYDSGGGNGWAGQGWDLSVGEISVDERWGAPRFDTTRESETYLLDGAMLIPNSLGATWAPRVHGDRQDYTRQVETEYEQIIRHEVSNQGPAGYFWEVHDKGGNVYWYGGMPDQGGPDGYNYLTDPNNPLQPEIDRSAIVTDTNGNGVRWLLSAQRDVGVNQISYHYTTITYQYGANGWVAVSSCTPSDTVLCARHTYLSSINYTEASTVAPAPDGDGEYEVSLQRESQVHPNSPVRSDPVVDAKGGFIDLTTDRLARVEVRHGSYTVEPTPDADGNEVRSPRNYNQLSVRYDLGYTTGPFGKSLLSSVTQVGSDGTTSATHTFTYYNRVSTGPNSYDGFAPAADWNTGSDLPDRLLLDSSASIGALGSSESNSGEGHAYIGFNPIIPEKVGSFGGSLQIGGGATEAIAEWLDINGDGLPDKVYRDSDGVGGDLNDVNRDGPIRFRLNRGGPNGSVTFGNEQTVTGISRLSTEGNFGIEGAFEAFPGVTVAFGLGAEVSWGDAYFSDVNADGLPDYVTGGQVWFNHLDSNGNPVFELGSGHTPVPIEDATASTTLPQSVQAIQQKLQAANPLVDTVRRWTAPFSGTVTITAPVTLSPTGGSSVDGVRVAVQQNNTEVAAANLLNTGSQAFTAPISRTVFVGDRLYFRVGSVNDGANDGVLWSPTISYTSIDGVSDITTVVTDVNGLSQTRYSAVDDFILSGRPDTQVFMPYTGTVHFSATVDKLKVTSDDVKVQLLHNGQPVSIANAVFTSTFQGSRTVTADFSVAAPVQPTDPHLPSSQDSLTVKLLTDTPIDLNAISWNPAIAYTQAVDREGHAIDLATRPITMKMTPEIELYPYQSSSDPSAPWRTGTATTRNFTVVFDQADGNPGGAAVVAMKTRSGVVARGTATLPAAPVGGPFTATLTVSTTIQANTDYWFDVTIRNPALSDKTTLSSFKLTNGTPSQGITVPATLRWTGRQGIFPLPYRGWAVAGYNGDGNRATQTIHEQDFVINPATLPTATQTPTGFNDQNYNPPTEDHSYAYLPQVQVVSIPGQPAPITSTVWVGNRANLSASADRQVSSRLGSDTVNLGAGVGGGSGRAVNRISITAPSAKLAFGVGPLGASFGVGPSFGLVDYMDMNGDGYPDIVTPDSVTYTLPRGGYASSGVDPGHLAVTNQDLTLSLGVGFEQGLVDIKGNAKGKANATQGSGAAKGSDAADSGGGIALGASFDVSWTSPNASGPPDAPIVGGVSGDPTSTYADQISQTGDVEGLPGDTAPIQLGLADVNGDGLPDRVFTTPSGVFAHYNLGYGFAAAPVKLSTGGFEAQESYAGGLSLGFTTPWQDFSGGAALNWNVDLSRYAWIDVNGDGILDQVHKIDNSHPPTVRFGTGTGMLPPVTYGQMADAHITNDIDAGQQASLDRTDGLGGQFDFTVSIGPLCLVACYLIINPGASYQNSISSTEIDLQDVNGDGYADSVQTLDDNRLTVRQNLQADTNLLSTVHNPLGGTMSITYSRDGNTVDNPSSVWDMASVTVNDGRTGDGVDVRRTNYTYQGLKTSRMHRDTTGYATVTETELDTTTNPPTPVRATVHQYLNDNIFNAGLETSTVVRNASNGGLIKDVRQTWVLRDARSSGADLGHLETAASLGYSLAPLMTQVVTEVGDGTSNVVKQSSTTNLTYDDLGDVVRQADLGEDDDPNDDVVADFIYSRCAEASTIGCADDQPHDNPSPIWNAGLCPTWVSLPVEITVTNGKTGADLKVYRHRDGHSAICDNASVTHLEEDLGNGQVASTELTYDAWGSYDRIVYPEGANGRRYSVQYVWDVDGHATIGQVTEYDLDPSAVDNFLGDGLQPGDIYTEGLTSSATFDPVTNRVASRTDANGNVIHYTYDALSRQASISSPVQSDPQPLVTYEYFLSTQAAPTAHAVAHHFDYLHPTDPINTATFVDGTGRVVQTQTDASLFRGAGQTAETGVIVSGSTFFDALGRPVAQYNPTKSTKAFGVYEDSVPVDAVNDPHTVTTYDLWDLPRVITDPGNRVTNIVRSYGQINGSGPQLFMTTETAPNGRATVTYADMRDVVRAVKDVPVGAPAQQTVYESDGMGQLVRTTDPTGFVTTVTYDMMGRRTSTNTPDGGLVTFGYDADGQQISKVTPNLRASNQQITYRYQLHRLTQVDYPGSADDVTYTYGGMGAADNGAGQVVRLEDASQIERNKYDPAGNVITQTTTMKLHAWTPGGDQSRFTWTTQWQYDGLGRLKSMVYPDSERVTYGYDAGGLVNAISGDEDGVKTVIVGYDQYGNPIYGQVPWTWHYNYLNDRQYDVFLHRRYDVDGNGVTSEWSFDANTQWLAREQTISANRDVHNQGNAYKEIQDLSYTYDSVGNPGTYRNDVPPSVNNLFSGPVSETYSYDPYERVVGATGQYDLAPSKVQHFSESLTFDARGNVTAKNQLDQIRNNNKENTQAQTSYSYSRTYSATKPHQVAVSGTDTYSYDADGNLVSISDSRGRLIRGLTWDANDRMRNVSDASSSTDYTYDDSGQRAIERGPSGETATLNPWATVRNTTEIYKYVWAGDDRLAAQRDNGGNEELQRYFLHKDLQGSTNIVTDYQGNTFQHQEYFANGEVWISDNSTVFRTPFQYGGSYVDETRALGNFGGRWYDQVREMMYSPDPVLSDDPSAMVSTPSLRAAYAYAGSNSITNVDPSGRQFTPAQRKAFIKANFQRARELVANDPALRASLEANLKTRLPKSFVRLGLDIKSAELHQKRFEMIDDIAKPFVEINITTGEVQLSPGLFKQFTVRKGKGHTSNASTQSAGSSASPNSGTQAGATNASGGPAVSGGTGTGPTAGSGAGKGVPGPMRPTRPRRAAPPPPPAPPHGANTVKGST